LALGARERRQRHQRASVGDVALEHAAHVRVEAAHARDRQRRRQRVAQRATRRADIVAQHAEPIDQLQSIVAKRVHNVGENVVVEARPLVAAQRRQLEETVAARAPRRRVARRRRRRHRRRLVGERLIHVARATRRQHADRVQRAQRLGERQQARRVANARVAEIDERLADGARNVALLHAGGARRIDAAEQTRHKRHEAVEHKVVGARVATITTTTTDRDAVVAKLQRGANLAQTMSRASSHNAAKVGQRQPERRRAEPRVARQRLVAGAPPSDSDDERSVSGTSHTALRMRRIAVASGTASSGGANLLAAAAAAAAVAAALAIEARIDCATLPRPIVHANRTCSSASSGGTSRCETRLSKSIKNTSDNRVRA
jgi:hypothetical protein